MKRHPNGHSGTKSKARSAARKNLRRRRRYAWRCYGRVMWTDACHLCGKPTGQFPSSGFALCERSLTGRDCADDVQSRLEVTKPGRVWNADDYRDAIKAVQARQSMP